MSYAKVTLDWPGGRNDFALDWPQMRALETETGQGPMQLLNALRGGQFRVDHLLAILRLGLSGAGMVSVEADRVVAAATRTHGPGALLEAATLALAAGVIGAPQPDIFTEDADSTDQGDLDGK